MLEEMEGDLATAKKDEATAATGFEELSAAKASEIASATSAIESKTKRSGEVAVEVVQTQDDMEDTEKEVAETQVRGGDARGVDGKDSSGRNEYSQILRILHPNFTEFCTFSRFFSDIGYF